MSKKIPLVCRPDQRFILYHPGPHRCSCFLYPGIQKRRFHDDDTGHAAGSAAEAGHRITGCRNFLGVDLSSFAVMALAPATLISHDMYTLYKPNATEKQKSTLSRVIIIIIGIVSIAICNFQPAVVDMVNWCFSFGIPVFIMGVIGLWWKRSTKASVITFIITWIVVCIWSTFGLQNALGWANFHVNYISLIVALIVGVISTAVLPGKKGLFAGKRA